MAWYRCGGGGIPSSLKGDMNDVFNKKFGTVLQDYPPEDWPGTVNLMGPLPEKTVSGSVVAFSDGADAVLLKSCAVTIAPTLDGVSSVGVVSAGKNIVDFSEHINASSGGFTFSKVANGGISFSTASAGSWAYVTSEFDFFIPKNTTITFSRDTAFNFRHYVRLTYKDGTTQNVYINADTTSATVTTSEEVTAIRLYMSQLTQGESYSGTVYLMIEVGSTATAYEPYVSTTHTANLGRTIYGGSVDVVNGTGTDENGNDFTFTAVPIISRLGDNTMWADGDLSVTYRRDIDLALAQ